MLRESSQRYWLLPCPKHPNSFHSTPQTFKIASNKAYTLIKKYGAFRHVLDNGGYLCPLAGCKSNSPFTPANPNEARVDCPTCHRGFCKFCMEGWGMHKETCQLYDEYVLPPPADPRDMLLRTLVEGCSMRCPGLCNRLLQKGEGSIHIRNCGDPECGTDFCYGCGRLRWVGPMARFAHSGWQSRIVPVGTPVYCRCAAYSRNSCVLCLQW